jgi:hypothetical protein
VFADCEARSLGRAITNVASIENGPLTLDETGGQEGGNWNVQVVMYHVLRNVRIRRLANILRWRTRLQSVNKELHLVASCVDGRAIMRTRLSFRCKPSGTLNSFMHRPSGTPSWTEREAQLLPKKQTLGFD